MPNLLFLLQDNVNSLCSDPRKRDLLTDFLEHSTLGERVSVNLKNNLSSDLPEKYQKRVGYLPNCLCIFDFSKWRNVSEENATFVDRPTIATSPAILKTTSAKRDVILAVMIEPTSSLETPPPPWSPNNLTAFLVICARSSHFRLQKLERVWASV